MPCKQMMPVGIESSHMPCKMELANGQAILHNPPEDSQFSILGLPCQPHRAMSGQMHRLLSAIEGELTCPLINNSFAGHLEAQTASSMLLMRPHASHHSLSQGCRHVSNKVLE